MVAIGTENVVLLAFCLCCVILDATLGVCIPSQLTHFAGCGLGF